MIPGDVVTTLKYHWAVHSWGRISLNILLIAPSSNQQCPSVESVLCNFFGIGGDSWGSRRRLGCVGSTNGEAGGRIPWTLFWSHSNFFLEVGGWSSLFSSWSWCLKGILLCPRPATMGARRGIRPKVLTGYTFVKIVFNSESEASWPVKIYFFIPS